MADPFNSVAELKARTSFSQGNFGTAQSVDSATFTISQFQNALQDARDFIFARTNSTANADFTATRLPEIKEAERYFALERLYEIYGEEIALKSPDANIAAVAEVMSGADTPSPYEKSAHWINVMSTKFRARGLLLLNGQPFQIKLGKDTRTDRFPCLLPKRYKPLPETVCGC